MNKTETSANVEFRKKSLQSFLAVSFYMIVSIGLVFLNRLLLSNKAEPTGALFISWYQFIIAYICIIIMSIIFPNGLFPPLKYRLSTFIQIVPVSCSYLLMIGFNNKCLEYVSVSEYQVVRSLTIFFNIIETYLILHQTTSLRACLACAGIVIGFILGVGGDVGHMSFKGAVYGVFSSIFVALYSITVKRALDLLENNQYLVIEYNTPISIILLIPFVWWNKEFSVFKEGRSLTFWLLQTFTGIVGFVINIAIFLDIKYTTPLTHNIAGTVKACLQTVLSFILFNSEETINWMKGIGISCVILFSMIYSMVRRNEMKKKIESEHEHANEEKKPLLENTISIYHSSSSQISESDDENPEKPSKRGI